MDMKLYPVNKDQLAEVLVSVLQQEFELLFNNF